ncbi:MAG: YdeI/OmpD-associated family protein [Gallionella sp.]|nr:YdeI/OmpD-associated family protein [Gallionella sp.]
MPESKTRHLKRAKNPMPAFVRSALNERVLMEAYRARPPYQQNDYLGWIARAKLEATKLKRLDQMLQELQGGNLYMNMAWKPRAERGHTLLHRAGAKTRHP